MLAVGVGSVTPGAIGDFSKSFAPAIGDRTAGLWASTLDRLYDGALLLLLGTVAAGMASGRPGLEILGVGAALVAGALALRYQTGLARLWRADSAVVRFAPRISPLAVPVTAAAALVAFVRFSLLAAALGLPLGGRELFIAFVLTSGVAALPLSVGGLGTRDVALVTYLGTLGVSAPESVALASLCFALQMWNVLAAGFVWLGHAKTPPR